MGKSVDVLDGTQITQRGTEEHRFYFSMQTQRSLNLICVNLCSSVLSVCYKNLLQYEHFVVFVAFVAGDDDPFAFLQAF